MGSNNSTHAGNIHRNTTNCNGDSEGEVEVWNKTVGDVEESNQKSNSDDKNDEVEESNLKRKSDEKGGVTDSPK